MTDFASLLQPDRGGPAHAIHLVDKDSFADWAKKQSAARRALLEAGPVRRQDGLPVRHPARRPGHEWDVVSTVANVAELSPWCLARLAEALPEGTYRLAEGDPGPAMLGWLLGQHRFTAYKSKNR